MGEPSWILPAMKVFTIIVLVGAVSLAAGDGRGHGPRRQGRRQGRRRGQRVRGGRQQFADLGPPPQPDLPNIPNLPPPPVAAPAPALPANRFLPTGPVPGAPLPPESPVRGRIPDRDGNYDFEFETDEGELVSFTYKADENGYQAQGSHLPEAPPLHPHIQRGLELIARVNQRNNRKRA